MCVPESRLYIHMNSFLFSALTLRSSQRCFRLPSLLLCGKLFFFWRTQVYESERDFFAALLPSMIFTSRCMRVSAINERCVYDMLARIHARMLPLLLLLLRRRDDV
jgi:hypothetical protein